MTWTPHPGDPAAFSNFIRIHTLIDKQKAATGIFVFKMIRCNENICGEWKLWGQNLKLLINVAGPSFVI